MSVLDALDATTICGRSSKLLADPAVWARPVPMTVRHRAAPTRCEGYSWRSLARNPHALMVTGIVGAVMARDAALHIYREVVA